MFIVPTGHGTVHSNQVNNLLQLQVDIFCCDIASGLRQWCADVADNAEVQGRIAETIVIHDFTGRDMEIYGRD
ncbi:hypothetical protein EBF16_16255 [Sphingobium yanoikuyae]|uniref:Uncharacterized protein n=2 Tax=Sphingobium yanoikuyae TaxID=13690 RepID=A0A3G2UWF5_SPHYA|nr:hypothetical protein EBF16_16255 [Sphingobium yanoikuyae]